MEDEVGDELRRTGALGWSGSRAVRMVRKERARRPAYGASVGVVVGAGAQRSALWLDSSDWEEDDDDDDDDSEGDDSEGDDSEGDE
ncbi:hypothetical protein DL93DRAFT_2090536 [Clavulina sp. PMI_390]|nr:hypothetical protein DL93DRAFT_2090536 [Clavulina sp. PMI_390]